jgi:hypothetical protein
MRLIIEIARADHGAAYKVLYRSFFEAMSRDSAKSAAESLFAIQAFRGANFVKIADVHGNDLCSWRPGQHSWSNATAAARTNAKRRLGRQRVY